MPRRRRKDLKKRVFAEKGNGKGTWVYADDAEAGHYIGGGNESNVWGGRYTVKRGSREREIELAEKVFYEKHFRSKHFRNPEKQFVLIQGLAELNRKKRLGLRMPVTARILRKPREKPSLLFTWFREKYGLGLKHRSLLGPGEKKQFDADQARQVKALEQEGYTAINGWRDKFEPYLDPGTGNYTALLLDFGGIVKKG